MEYQENSKLDRWCINQPSKYRTNNRVEINYESRGTCNDNSQIKFKTTMLRSILCDCCDAYILVKGTLLLIKQLL